MGDGRRWREDDRYRRQDDDRYRAESEYSRREPGYWPSGRRYEGEGRWGYEGRGYGGERGWQGREGYDPRFGTGFDTGYGREGRGREGSGRDEDRGMWDRATDEVSSWFGDEEAERRRRMDAEPEGRHRGRGPKGYARSDDRIREDVSDRLSDDPMVDASEIEVAVANREVTLSGTVDSREARRRAEDCAERVSGVSYVQNNLRVQRSVEERAETTGAMAGIGGNIVR